MAKDKTYHKLYPKKYHKDESQNVKTCPSICMHQLKSSSLPQKPYHYIYQSRYQINYKPIKFGLFDKINN